MILSVFVTLKNRPMPNTFVFADEAGCFSFNREPNVSKFFILCTVTMSDCAVATDLLDLRRKLAWEGAELNDYFHATVDKQAVRDRVFEVITKHEFAIQATIMEKSKAQEHVKASKPRFYQYGYYYHFKFGVAPSLGEHSETLVTTASLGTKKERIAFEDAVADVMRQTHKPDKWRTDFMPSQADPCLQVADYCAWAIQRKWERGDVRSYSLIKDRISYEYNLWQRGERHYY
jgi:Protein of unknown function (DUF3800)